MRARRTPAPPLRTFRSPSPCAATASTRSTSARSPWSTATAGSCTARATPRFVTMTRSALKPFQAMPFVAAGGLERFGYTTRETALLCASHSGEPRHVEAVAAMLAKAGNTVDDLQCGSHAPGFYEARGEVPPQPPYSPLAHNCSGKHSGMLAYCVQCGLPKASYLEFGHPLQQEIRRSVAHFTGVAEADLLERHRRLLGTELRGADRGARARLRAPRQHAGRSRVWSGAEDARGRDDRPPGDGFRRAPQRPRTDACGAGRLGHQDRRGRRPGDRHPQPRLGHRGQDRRRLEARPPSGDRGDARGARSARRRPARGTCRMGRPQDQELPRHRSRARCARCLY